jgi:DNA repair protein RadD
MELRPYQKQAVDAIIRDFSFSGNSVAVLATGAGKSLIIAEVARILSPRPVLILQPTLEILLQNKEKLERYFPDVGVYSASAGEKSIKKITLATIGSIPEGAVDFRHFKYILVDECHLVDITKDEAMYMMLFDLIQTYKVIGLTATPWRQSTTMFNQEMVTTTKVITRMRGKRKTCFWNKILINITTEYLVKEGYLCPLTYHDNSNISHEIIPTNKTETDFNLQAYEEMLLPDEENIAHTIVRLGKVSKSVLIFCVSVEQATRFSEVVQNSEVVSGTTSRKERKRIVEGFKTGKIKFVFNVSCMTTGFDHPSLDAICLLRPTRSLALYCQMLGRGLRNAPGKTTCRVVDFSGTFKSIGRVESIKLFQGYSPYGRPEWDIMSDKRRSWHGKVLYKLMM